MKKWLRVWNVVGSMYLSMSLLAQGATLYVVNGNPNAAAPYADWATAAADIQTAINAAVGGDTILVTNGTYALTAQLNIGKAVTLRSANGAAGTVLDGGGTVRCVYLHDAAAVMDGFTIQNGAMPDAYGGGVYLTVGTLVNCTVRQNAARYGAGVCLYGAGLVNSCVLRDNNVVAWTNVNHGGGGAYINNGGTMRNCLVTGNTSDSQGGGIDIWTAGTVQNCTVVGNTAPNGAGLRARLASTVLNTIIYNNLTGAEWQLSGTGQAFTNCATPIIAGLPGAGNIANDPQFLVAGDYHLQSGSPCINAGVYQTWMTGATDLDGDARLANDVVDIGAYERREYTFTTWVGQGEVSGTTDGIRGAARFNKPWGVARTSAGLVYVTDQFNHTIRKVSPGGVVTTFAGLAGVPGSTDGTGGEARFYYPLGIAVDIAGYLYVCDYANSTIRKISPAGVVTTLAGLAGSAGFADGSGSAARFNVPVGIAVDGAGFVYVADRDNNIIRKISPAGEVTTLAGMAGVAGYVDGSGSDARFYHPYGLAADAAGNLYVSEEENHTIRKITAAGQVTTLAGMAGVAGTADGNGSDARFYFPYGVTVDSSGYVYVTERGDTIRKISPTGLVTTIGGLSQNPGSVDGTGFTARFHAPTGITVDENGNLYVADCWNHTVRSTSTAPILPVCSLAISQIVANPLPNEGAAIQYTVTVANSGPDTANGIQIADALPAGLTLTGNSPSQGSYAGGVWSVGSLALGASATLQLQATVNTGTGGTSITNTANLTAVTEEEWPTTDNTAAAPIYVPLADVGVSQGVNQPLPIVGEAVQFTVLATNLGPDAATALQISDNLPAGLTLTGSSASQGSYAAGVWSVGTLAANGSATLTLSATINAGTPGQTLTNTAAITAGAVADHNAANNSASASVHVPLIDLGLTKNVSQPTAIEGEQVQYTLVVTNAGADGATLLSVSSVLPSGVTLISSSSPDFTTNGNVWTIATLVAGGSATLTVTVQINSGTAGSTLSGAATVTAHEQEANPGDNTSGTASLHVPQVDIGVTLAVSNPRPNENEVITYTVQAANLGPDTATGITIQDLLPAGLTWIGASNSDYADSNGVWTVGTLSSGGNATLTLTAQVNAATAGLNITNTAALASVHEFDAVAGNNAADSILHVPLINLGLTKTADQERPIEGETVAFTLVVTNAGPDNASSVAVANVLPTGVTFVSSSSPAFDANANAWTIGALALNASATLVVQAQVNAGTAGTDLDSTTTVTGFEKDSDLADNSDGANLHVPLVDLGIQKTVDQSRPIENELVLITLVATNLGPDYASQVVVSDVMPPNVTFINSSSPDFDAGLNRWNLGTLTASNSATLTVRVRVNNGTAGGPDLDSTTTIIGHEKDANLANNSSNAPLHVPLVDVGVSQNITVPPAHAPHANVSNVLTIAIGADNSGPDYASVIRIADNLPSGYTLLNATATLGTFAGGVWTIGQLDAHSNATLTLQVQVNLGTQGGWVTNTAALVSTHERDSNSANNSAGFAVYIESSDIEITQVGEDARKNAKWSIPLAKEGEYRMILNYDMPKFFIKGVGEVGSTNPLSTTWHHLVGRFTHNTNAITPHTLDLFVDGEKVATLNTGGTLTSSNTPLCLGVSAPTNGLGWFGGAMDELRISQTARSDGWLLTAFNQESSPDTFITVGAEAAGSVWSFQKTLTINHAKVGGDVTNFPVLVKIADTALMAAAEGGHVQHAQGYDLKFTLPDGTPLSHEVERYAGNTGTLVAWVKLPLVTAATDTEFLMHYGDAATVAPTAMPADVWDSNYAMVQHFDELTGDLLDSTVAANNGANNGARHQYLGRTASAYMFDGVSNHVTMANSAALSPVTHDLTVEGWFIRQGTAGERWYKLTIVNKGPDPAAAVVVEDRMSNMTYAESFGYKGQYIGSNNTWLVGTLQSNEEASIWISSHITAASNFVNVAEVMYADQADTDSPHGNNVASEDDQTTHGLGPTPPSPLLKPNFELVSIVTTPTNLTLGGAFSAAVTIRNTGDGSGNMGAVRLWLDHPTPATPGEAGDASQTGGTLAVGATQVLTFNGLTAPATAGTYLMRAYVDANDAVAELSEGDNQKTLTCTLHDPLANQPDFVITSLITVPATLTPGGTFDAVVTVLNNGPLSGDAGTVRLWLNKSAAALVGEAGDASQAGGTLAAGASTVLTFSGLTAPSANGTYTLRAFADALGATTEKAEDNNQKALTYTFAYSGTTTDKPDFIITSLTTAPAPVKGGAFSAVVTVKNQGTAAGDGGVLRLWANHYATATAGEAGDAATAVGSLAVGASTTLTINGLAAPASDGTYTLRAFVDADGTVAEQAEGNNQKTLTYTFAPSGAGGGGGGGTAKPDFVVTAISFSPATLTMGATFTAYVTVVNNGPVVGNAGSVDVYINRPTIAPAGTAGDASQALGILAAGETRVLTFTGLTAPSAKGTYTFRAFIDSLGATAEQSEGNNQKTRTYGFY